MTDNLSILLTHVLILVMLWRLLGRRDLDRDVVPQPPEATISAEPSTDDKPRGWRSSL